MIDNNSKKEKIPWYLIDSENSSVFKVWDCVMTSMIIYCQIMGPVIMVFPDIYMYHDPDTDTWEAVTDSQKNLVLIETIIDVFYCIDIIISFFKWTRVNRDLRSIALNYIQPSFPENFAMDLIGTLPGIISGESFKYYWLKFFRIILYMIRLTDPFDVMFKFCL